MSSAKDVAEQTDVIVTGKTMNINCSRSDQLLFIFVRNCQKYFPFRERILTTILTGVLMSGMYKRD